MIACFWSRNSLPGVASVVHRAHKHQVALAVEIEARWVVCSRRIISAAASLPTSWIASPCKAIEIEIHQNRSGLAAAQPLMLLSARVCSGRAGLLISARCIALAAQRRRPPPPPRGGDVHLEHRRRTGRLHCHDRLDAAVERLAKGDQRRIDAALGREDVAEPAGAASAPPAGDRGSRTPDPTQTANWCRCIPSRHIRIPASGCLISRW